MAWPPGPVESRTAGYPRRAPKVHRRCTLGLGGVHMSLLPDGTLNMRVRWLRLSAWLLVWIVGIPLPARGADLPATLRASMLVRVLAYDRRMGQRPPPLILGVAHRQGDEASESQGREFSSALEVAARGR